MDLENGDAFGQIGQIYVDLAIETAGTQQGFVENVHAVGRSQNNHAGIGAKAVHLCQELVQRILAFVIAAEGSVLAARTAYGINLINENNARSFFLCLAEEVADATCADADKHFDKIRAGKREERYVGFAGYSLCQKRFSRSGRAYEQRALWYFTT